MQMTTTFNLLTNWLLQIGAIDHPGIMEVNEYDDPESYLCGAGYEHLTDWERGVLKKPVGQKIECWADPQE
jgi:hypothetical protein